MPNKQIHEVPAAVSLDTDDQILVSKAGSNLTRRSSIQAIPYSNALESSVDQTISQKLTERISVKDFGAKGDGIEDDAPAFNAALSSESVEIFVPAGTYRLASEVEIGINTRLIGSGYGNTVLIGDHAGIVVSISGAEYVNSSVTDIGIDMGAQASTGILVYGHRAIIERIWFRHGSPTSWALDMVDANECVLTHIMAGISGSDEFTANGIRWRNSDPLTNAVNYGDSIIIQPVIRLASPNTTAMLFDGGLGGHLINNITIDRAQINAPQSGPTPYANTVGMHFKNTSRIRVMGCGFEAIAVGVKEEAHTDSAGANVGNTYVGVYAINALVPYEDSNGVATRSVQQRTFIGCDSFPQGAGLSDGDSLVPAAMFLSSYNTGTPGICIRSFKPETVLLTPDGTSNEERPSKGLMVQTTSSNATIVTRPQGQSSNVLSRLELGNGPTNADGGLRDITVKDPLRLEPRSLPLVASTSGHIVYVENNDGNVVGGTAFDGPGLYCLLPRQTNSGQRDWVKIASNPL